MSAAAALTVTSPDGVYALELSSEWVMSGPATATPVLNAFDVELLVTRATEGRSLASISAAVISEQKLASLSTWSGTMGEHEIACNDTASANRLKPELRSWCVIGLDEQRAVVVVMRTRQLLNVRTNIAIFRSSLAGIRLLSTAPEAMSDLPERGFVCISGRWNARAPAPDLEVWWKPEQGELIAHFLTLDGPAPVSFFLSGTVDIGGEGDVEFFGYLDQFDGPVKSRSGIHRLFGAMGVQGELTDGVPVRIRSAQDASFTELTACGEPADHH